MMYLFYFGKVCKALALDVYPDDSLPNPKMSSSGRCLISPRRKSR